MAIDTPARIAVIGAGPVGLEAALYGRYLGYDVDLYERGRVCQHLLDWGRLRLFTPFRLNSSPLGIAALKAQDPAWAPPHFDALLTGRELVEAYFTPLAQSDLLAESLHLNSKVLTITVGKRKRQLWEDEDSPDGKFRLRLVDGTGEREARADVVIDASGTFAQQNRLGPNGDPAPGEMSAEHVIEYRLPDILDVERARYAGRHVLVVGAGCSAATNVIALARLAEQSPETRITWITRGQPSAEGPARIVPDGPYPAREQIARTANGLAKAGQAVRHWAGTTIESLSYDPAAGFTVQLSGLHRGQIEADALLANVGFRPNNQFTSELKIEFSERGAATTIAGRIQIVRPRHFHVLGAKSFGSDSSFLISNGFEQIRQLFAVLGGRAALDIYATMSKLAGESR